MNVWRHVRALWPGYGILLPLPFVVWLCATVALGELRWELFAVAGLVVTLAYSSERTKRLFQGLYPIALFGLLYDASRFVKHLGIEAARIHVCDLRDAEVRIFPFTIEGVRGTVHDYFVTHHWAAVDLVTAVPYGTFIFAAVLAGSWLYFKSPPELARFGWSFFFVNVAGIVIHHVYPSAPPWYFHDHGCAIDLATAASEGPRLANVDAILGVPYFHGFYARSNDVFGALPSLHVAYPTLILLHGWRHAGWPVRALALAYFATMAFAAVYLDHHWILDVVAGVSLSALVVFLVNRISVANAERSKRMDQPRMATAHGA